MQGSRIIGWIILIVGVILAVKTANNVVRIWKAGGRVETAQKQLLEAEETNKKLKVRLEEVKSSEFVEKEARDKLGYIKSGEELLIIPPPENSSSQITNTQKPEKNWQAWWRLYISH